MAFPTTMIHVVSAFSGFPGFNDFQIPAIGEAEWSDSRTDAGTGTKIARGVEGVRNNVKGSSIFRVFSTVDAYFVVGLPAEIDIDTSPRHILKAGEEKDIVVREGYTWAWVPA